MICNHVKIIGRWAKNPDYDAAEDAVGGFSGDMMEWVSGETQPTTVDLDLHRYQCTQCNRVMYYSDAARKFFEEGISTNIQGLEQTDLDEYNKNKYKVPMKKQLQEYSRQAIRTEATIDQVQLNPVFFLSVLDIAIAAGSMLDQMKKHAFYGKEYDTDKIKENFVSIVTGLDGVKHSLTDINDDRPLEIDPRIFHAILGIATESTELLEALDIDGRNLDTVNLLEESFDIDWYQFILLDAVGGDLQNVWDTGIAKLKDRFPIKFTAEDAINRDVGAERKILNNINRDVDTDRKILNNIDWAKGDNE